MKKLMFVVLLLVALTTFSVADEGDSPGGGKSCPNGQPTCSLAEQETVIVKTVKIIISFFI